MEALRVTKINDRALEIHGEVTRKTPEPVIFSIMQQVTVLLHADYAATKIRGGYWQISKNGEVVTEGLRTKDFTRALSTATNCSIASLVPLPW